MPYKPLISKIRCHNPNRKGSRIANKNYLTYIATREGVDISNLKDINDFLQQVDLSKLELNDNKIHDAASNSNYLWYIAKRPKSHGLFGNIDTTNLDIIAKDVSQLTGKGICIYRGIISLSEKDAEALGFTDKSKWDTYLKLVMPDIAKELGVSPSNFTWVAAFHAEKTHPHVHYELWDNTNKVKSPFIHTAVQNKCRKILSDAAFDNDYENIIKEIYKSEREELNSLRNKSRSNLTDWTKDIMNTLDVFVPGIKTDTLPDRISLDEVNELSKGLIQLIKLLPTHGSVDYAFLPPEVKDEVNKINQILLNRADMKKELFNYLKAVEDSQLILGKTKFDIKIAKEKAQKDINTRIGNIVIKKAKVLKKHENSIENALTKSENENDFSYNIHDNVDINIDIDNKNEIDKDILLNNNFESHNELHDEVNDGTLKSKIGDKEYFINWNKEYKNALTYLYDHEKQDFQKAFSILNEEAIKGNVLAIHDIGKMYEKGLGREIDNDNANQYYVEAFKGFNIIEANKPHKYLEYRIGKLCESGKGTTQNYEEAVKWYQMSAKHNYKYAQYSLGMLYLKDRGIKLAENGFYKREALRLFQASSLQNNAYASFEAGKMFEKGIATNVDIVKSKDYYKKAFEGFLEMSHDREDDNLMYRIGKMYYDGVGVEKDENEAIKYLEKSAKLNNVNAQFVLAKIYMNSENPKIDEAMDLLKKLVSADNSMAQYSLGKIYLEGKYIDKDIDEALKLLSKSADQENQFAQYQLGKMLYEGTEIPPDIDKAIELLNASAEQNNEYAQYTLGKIFSDEEKEYYDIEKSINLYQKSADQGNQFAQYQLGKMLYEGTKVTYNFDKAIQLLNASAEQNNEYAQYTLGKIFSDEEKEYYDIDAAVKWYLKSAEQGNQFAQYQLGKMLYEGTKIPYEFDKAIEMLNASAKQKNDYAQYTLGKIFSNQEKEYYDIDAAVKWYLKSAEQGNQFAQYQLGKMYLFGNKVQKNEELGLYWINKAIDQGNEYAMKTLEIYEKYKDQISLGVAYSIFKVAFSMLTQQCQNASLAKDKFYISRSKQAMKEEALKQKVRGGIEDTENN